MFSMCRVSGVVVLIVLMFIRVVVIGRLNVLVNVCNVLVVFVVMMLLLV